MIIIIIAFGGLYSLNKFLNIYVNKLFYLLLPCPNVVNIEVNDIKK